MMEYVIRLVDRFVIPAAVFNSTDGSSSVIPEYEIKYSFGLEKVNSYTSSELANLMNPASKRRISTAGEELAIQLQYEAAENIVERLKSEGKIDIGDKDCYEIVWPKIKMILEHGTITDQECGLLEHILSHEDKLLTDSRKARVFGDLFARGSHGIYMLQRTGTFLRVPEYNKNPAKPDKIVNGRKQWIREFGHGSEVLGTTYVTESGVVPKTSDPFDVWDPIGIPRVTYKENEKNYYDHTTHFRFNPVPYRGESGFSDIIVARERCQHHEEGECLVIDACNGNFGSAPRVGFRLVEGPLPKIEQRQ